jgi:Cu/Ag efflux protein CusF
VKSVSIALIGSMLVLRAVSAGAETAQKPATQPASAQPSVQREKVEELSATVVSVDPATRMIGLQGEDGSSASFAVGDEVKNFKQIRVGDKVVVSYYRGIAAELQPKGTPLSKKVDQLDIATGAQPGSKPGAGAGSAVRGTVVIEKVDTKANTVTFRRPDGLSRTLPVESPEGREFLTKIKKGDQVEVLYIEAVAIEVRPK